MCTADAAVRDESEPPIYVDGPTAICQLPTAN